MNEATTKTTEKTTDYDIAIKFDLATGKCRIDVDKDFYEMYKLYSDQVLTIENEHLLIMVRFKEKIKTNNVLR